MYRLAVWCGIACFAVTVVTEQIFKTVVPESVIQVVWIALITGFAAWCGYRVPTLGWQAGATIIVVMWFGWVALWLVTGELFHPSTSTGGLVAVFISGLLTALVSPLPMLAAELAVLTLQEATGETVAPVETGQVDKAEQEEMEALALPPWNAHQTEVWVAMEARAGPEGVARAEMAVERAMVGTDVVLVGQVSRGAESAQGSRESVAPADPEAQAEQGAGQMVKTAATARRRMEISIPALLPMAFTARTARKIPSAGLNWRH